MKSAKITLGVLILLTLISALFAQQTLSYSAIIILALAGLKFLGISYYFIELIKAHVFWRFIVAAFVFIILAIILVIRY
ncbi:hypothetical protein C1T31_11865 [Hanstruepera neustonica]|uniref:Cytochrome C oxidase subunit IV n=1 Tax=Hanstruepera neustonica TaxID=1445657 RepID=A0A2K1DWV1_9FLAO|nr:MULTISPECIES: hypothetical protein [Hanstruepera]PNQ72479.1 hypothetical protein C1T31_11865 [Hanstruepera neustonica]